MYILSTRQPYFRIAKLSLLFFVFSFCRLPSEAQQDALYSQYMFNMLNINPAYAGNRVSNTITALFRNQWIGLEGAPETLTMSWDTRPSDSNVGYGVQLYNDQIGMEKTSGVKGFYSYYIPLNNSVLNFGLSMGLCNYQVSYSLLKEAISGDPMLQNDVNSWNPTAGIGVRYASESWYLGLSLPSLLQKKRNNSSSLKSNNILFIATGYSLNAGNNVYLKPSILVKSAKGYPVQADVNMNCWYNNIIGVGASYRTNDALIGMLELQVLPQWRLGYAYDYTMSDLKSYNRGTHELMLRFEWGRGKRERILSPRYY